MPTSSIDEMLMGGSTSQHPMSPEEKFQESPEPIEEYEDEEPAPESESEEPSEDTESDSAEALSDDDEDKTPDRKEPEIDEYGNEKERMPKGMKDRLDRKEKQYQRDVEQRDREIQQLRTQLSQQGASREVQNAAKDFEYDPEASGDWQQQLASFVKQTVSSMTREQEEGRKKQEEAQVQHAFEAKFRDGMNRFDDFQEVIVNLPFEISNPMTLATRSMENPAAFLYAAAKRHPQDLERISKIRDPYGQMMEMGKLEERMRKNKATTNAPRPLGRTKEDATSKVAPKQEGKSGDLLLAGADAKRMAAVKTRIKGNR